MTKYRISKHARSDLTRIRTYTSDRYGTEQCKRYLQALTACFRMLAETPSRGRRCDRLRPGLMRMEEGEHVVFFVQKPYGVRIVRVLHKRMLPERHELIDNDEE